MKSGAGRSQRASIGSFPRHCRPRRAPPHRASATLARSPSFWLPRAGAAVGDSGLAVPASGNVNSTDRSAGRTARIAEVSGGDAATSLLGRQVPGLDCRWPSVPFVSVRPLAAPFSRPGSRSAILPVPGSYDFRSEDLMRRRARSTNTRPKRIAVFGSPARLRHRCGLYAPCCTDRHRKDARRGSAEPAREPNWFAVDCCYWPPTAVSESHHG